jgi:predicted RNase H-like HicB family nuclease
MNSESKGAITSFENPERSESPLRCTGNVLERRQFAILQSWIGRNSASSSLIKWKGWSAMATYTDLDSALTAKYPFAAIPTQDGEGWEIVFPDIPGVIGFADTWQAIGEEARAILHFHLEGTAEDGHPLPAPNHDWNPVAREPGDFAIPTLYSADEASRALGISRRRVAALAKSRNVGSKVGNSLVFTEQDLDSMRDRIPGRPPSDTDVERRAS